MASAPPIELGYSAQSRSGHSAWALVGFGLAVLSSAVPAMMAWTIWLGHNTSSAVVEVGVSPSYYLFPAAAIGLCVFGSRGRRKVFPALGVVTSLLAIGGVLLLVSRGW